MGPFTGVAALMVFLNAHPPRPGPVSVEAKRQVARGLVEQLGSPNFQERIEAEKGLVGLGAAVSEEVKAGMNSENAEVAERCARVLPKLVVGDLLREDGPAWKRFSKVTGDTDGAKRLYTAMVNVPEMAVWLDKIEADPTAAKAAHQWAVDTAHDQLAHPGRQRSPGDLDPLAVFMVYAGGFDGAGAVSGPTGATSDAAALAAFSRVRWVPIAEWAGGFTVVGEKRAPLPPAPAAEGRKLYERWASAQSSDAALYVILAHWSGPNVLPALKKAAADKARPLPLRLRCLHAAQEGGADILAEARGLFAENEEVGAGVLPEKGDPKETDQLTVQARDVAAAVAVRACGYDPADFGFRHYHRAWETSRFVEPPNRWWGANGSVLRYGFVSAAERERTMDTVTAFLALKPVPTKPTPLTVTPPPPDDPPELLALVAQNETARRGGTVSTKAEAYDPATWRLLARYPGYGGRIHYEAIRIALDTNPAADPPVANDQFRLQQTRTAPREAADLQLRLAARALARKGDATARRASAAKHLLEAYSVLVVEKLPNERPGVPKVVRLDPDARAKERAEFVVADTARRTAQYAADLFDQRAAVVGKLRELYKDAPDELKALAAKKLTADAVDGLMKEIK